MFYTDQSHYDITPNYPRLTNLFIAASDYVFFLNELLVIDLFLKKYSNFIFYRFMAVPFLFELRTLMDWIWTDTSMTLMDWLKMEDIFASVYLLKVNKI